MTKHRFVRSAALFLLAACLSLSSRATTLAQSLDDLRKSLVFHASFDRGVDADLAKGDGKLWSAPAMNKRDAATAGVPASGEVRREQDGGRFGGALRFGKSAGPMVFYKAEGNFPTPRAAPAGEWSATASFWLSTEPAKDLPDGFCDPLQITSKKWDDAAIFVEFEKRPAGIPFRLGVYADTPVWNPTGRKWETIPQAEKPLTAVEKTPFAAGKWTHVVLTVAHFNSGKADGVCELYLDGQPAGSISPRTQTFTWDPAKSAIMLGLGYIGLMDDLATFNRALTKEEVGTLYKLNRGVGELVGN